jgi:hypothetical protein
VQGDDRSRVLAANIGLQTAGTISTRLPPIQYPWFDPAYAVVQSSIVDCYRDLLRGLADPDYIPETTADDNLRTLRLVRDAYRSTEKHIAVEGSPTINLVTT